jgi:hypothetical protein
VKRSGNSLQPACKDFPKISLSPSQAFYFTTRDLLKKNIKINKIIACKAFQRFLLSAITGLLS